MCYKQDFSKTNLFISRQIEFESSLLCWGNLPRYESLPSFVISAKAAPSPWLRSAHMLSQRDLAWEFDVLTWPTATNSLPVSDTQPQVLLPSPLIEPRSPCDLKSWKSIYRHVSLGSASFACTAVLAVRLRCRIGTCTRGRQGPQRRGHSCTRQAISRCKIGTCWVPGLQPLSWHPRRTRWVRRVSIGKLQHLCRANLTCLDLIILSCTSPLS